MSSRSPSLVTWIVRRFESWSSCGSPSQSNRRRHRGGHRGSAPGLGQRTGQTNDVQPDNSRRSSASQPQSERKSTTRNGRKPRFPRIAPAPTRPMSLRVRMIVAARFACQISRAHYATDAPVSASVGKSPGNPDHEYARLQLGGHEARSGGRCAAAACALRTAGVS